MTQRGSNAPFQFNYIPYPLWRRRLPPLLGPVAARLWRRIYPVMVDKTPGPALEDVHAYVRRFRLLPDVDDATLTERLRTERANVTHTSADARPAITDRPLRLPAQWEPTERVMIAWAVNYPPLWAMHAALVAAIAPVATVQLNVPGAAWAGAVRLYLERHGIAHAGRVEIADLPTDDIWIRDYGPLVGFDADGVRAAAKLIYDPLPNYPQARDNAMPERWAASAGVPVHPLPLHGEGGNLWSDGAGTLLMTNQVYRLNPDLTRQTLLPLLHEVLIFEKLVITPRLRVEETGHIDLLVKLASANTVLLSAPNALFTGDRLRAARRQLERETNAAGDRYRVATLPTPPLYANWFGYPIRRTYTNALTVNGRVLVPVYGLATDEVALRTYERVMPGYTVVPIDSVVGINGGGAVHCMTREVPAAGG